MRAARFVPERRANGHNPSPIAKQRPIGPNACIDPALLSPYIANPATSEKTNGYRRNGDPRHHHASRQKAAA
jgi:hypothetical protein